MVYILPKFLVETLKNLAARGEEAYIILSVPIEMKPSLDEENYTLVNHERERDFLYKGGRNTRACRSVLRERERESIKCKMLGFTQNFPSTMMALMLVQC